MRYFRKQRRQTLADRASRNLPSPKQECLNAALVLTFTDQQLRYTEAHNPKNATLRDLPALLFERWDKDAPLDCYGDEAHDAYALHNRIITLINEVCKKGLSSQYLITLKSLAATIDQVKTKYGDPSKEHYQRAMNSGAEIAEIIQDSLTSSQDADQAPLLTAAQEEGLVAVLFLLRQSGEDESSAIRFTPNFNPKDTSIHRWTTAKILRSPEDVEGNIAAFRTRVERTAEVGLKSGMEDIHGMYEYDALCDYPDETIDRLAPIRNDDYRLWGGLLRYVVREGHGYQTMNEMLCFMWPLLSRFNIWYLVATIPATLRAYKSLPPMDDYSKTADAVRDQYAALLNVTITISGEFLGETAKSEAFINEDGTIRDQRLIDLLMQHPERGEQIASLIEERQTADFDMISEVASSVIGEGNL